MDKRNIIVIGASAGGFDAIKRIVADLPADLAASIFVVWHMSANTTGILPHVLNMLGTLPATQALDGELISENHIYVAPPDRHLLLENGYIRVTRGPKENRFRPAIDPLFRSAALAYGPRVIGIELSGALDDGAAGMWAIKQQGGLAIVQDPSDAEVPSMPKTTMDAVDVDYVLPVHEIGLLLTRLVKDDVAIEEQLPANHKKMLQKEVAIAMEDSVVSRSVFNAGELTTYTCPECHGVLSALREGGRIRFRCHTGHAFTAESLLAGITENIEESLWNAIRNVQESALLLNHMGDHFAEANQAKLAAMYFRKGREAMERSVLIRKAVFSHDQPTAEEIKEQARDEHLS
ncbi:chemotaxis protein CheB [Chitinophaga rhizophila]|uniref:protein-glutamate methylesterase n=1 Tax=Chitinophaga rhizophila TaxID=2866212 RepID=A0ABS7GH92_9BACT|nr:chemotaxis protein CheB [Chitinophaga rhizophila]MBW8687068.1 chemotaxis protein CheB [Chitinophaga rhizophila]